VIDLDIAMRALRDGAWTADYDPEET